jgi:hypothetical protein
MSAGKGDKPRPVDKKTFDNNFDQIDWKKKESTKDCKIFKGKKIYKY